MPEIVNIPEETPVQLESEPLQDPGKIVSDPYALALVKDTFQSYEQYRTNNHDRRWKDADMLYFGYVPQRKWEGTQIAKSSIGIPITFDQIHGIKPLIVQALFGTAGDYFSVEPLPGTQLQEANALKARMNYALEHPSNDFGGNAVNEFKLALQQVLQYGNGGVMLQYDPDSKLPIIESVDIRDAYFDPGANTPDVESGRSIIYRKLYTVAELDAMRGQGYEKMSIPDKNTLYTMANSRPSTFGDVTIRQAESYRGISYDPNSNTLLPMPSDRFVECLMYYDKKRVIWVLDRKWVAYNQKNDLGFFPFAFAPCYIVPGRFFAQSIADVQESNQRISEALMNGHLDELSLNMNPPRTRKRGPVLTPSQLKWRPGAVMESDDPRNDFIQQLPPQITTNVYQELAFFQSAADRRTGANAAITSGMPLASNASRTNAGISVQTQGPMSRISELIDNFENYLVVPILYKMQKMMEVYDKTDDQGLTQPLPGMQAGQMVQVDSGVLGKRCKFTIKAASKMLSREKLSGMFPFLANTLLSGQFIANLHQIGQTINFQDIFRAFQDATGTAGSYEFIRPMSPEEQQALNAPPPQVDAMMKAKQMDQQTRLQIAGQKNQVTSQIADKKNQTDLTKAAMDHHQKQDQQGEKSALELLNLMAQAHAGALTPPPGEMPQ